MMQDAVSFTAALLTALYAQLFDVILISLARWPAVQCNTNVKMQPHTQEHLSQAKAIPVFHSVES